MNTNSAIRTVCVLILSASAVCGSTNFDYAAWRVRQNARESVVLAKEHRYETNRITFTNGTMVISNAQPIRVDHSKLIYRYDGGGGSIWLSDLPQDLQDWFEFDPVQSAADVARDATLKRQDDLQRLWDAKLAASAARRADERQLAANEVDQQSRRIVGHVLQKVSDGVLITSGRLGDIEVNAPGALAQGTVFIGRDDFPNFDQAYDGQPVNILGYSEALYRYISVQKSSRTVRLFGTCRSVAIAMKTLATP
jgi:hypothetical protein